MTDKLISTLNKTQQEAVLQTEGAVLVLAGAGSGKTRVLTYRIANLISKGVKPSSILAVTFTNKAANEMKERLLKLVGLSAQVLWAGTFHSICVRLLREYGDQIGINKHFVIYDDYDQKQCIKKCVEKLHLDIKRYNPKKVLYLISEAKEKMVEPDEFANVFYSSDSDTVGRIYREYKETMQSNSALDFDDLIYYGVQLLEKCDKVREHYQKKFKYVHVDEYQDINYSQYRLITLLAEPQNNIFCVGDDDQSIYGWRGADISIILRFEKEYKDCKVFKLEQNYRSTKKILEAAYEVVKHNPSRTAKIIWTDNCDGKEIELINATDGDHEAHRVATSILDKVGSGEFTYSDCAILYRANALSRVFEKALINNRIPYKIYGGLRFYDRKEIKDILAYMRVALNPHDNISLLRIINEPTRGIGATSISKLSVFADNHGISIYDACIRLNELPEIKGKSAGAISSFVKLITHFNGEAKIFPPDQLIKTILDYSGYKQTLELERTQEAISKMENLDELYNVATFFTRENEDPTLQGFLEQVTLSSDLDTYSEGDNAVTLMTAHSSKGLEFPVVFIVGLEEGIFPHERSMNNSEELEEERRLMYVAMTRAEKELILSYADMRANQGQWQRNDRSNFINDIPCELLGSTNRVSISATTLSEFKEKLKIKPKNMSEQAFKVGNKVEHPSFGKGMVLNCQGLGDNEIVTVVFDQKEVGIKKLMVKLAKLVKV